MRRLLVATALWLAGTVPAWASSLPHVDFGTRPILGVSVGTTATVQPEASLSLDLPVTDSIMVGGALSGYLPGRINYDVRGLYRLVDETPDSPAIGGEIGLWGQPGDPNFQIPIGIAPYVGFALAYAYQQFDARVNLVYSPLYTYNTEVLGVLGGPPGTGIEVGYHFTPRFELTLGLDGRGDVLGVNYTF